MKKVSFTEMKNGTKDDYLFLDKYEKDFANNTSERILNYMSNLTQTLKGYQISRLEHSLQCASRAYNNGESEEMVVAALLHDIGDELAPMNHSEYAASILKPYVSEKTHWIIEKHGEFQMYYYAHHLGGDRNKRDQYKNHKYFQATIDFCENYDQNSFDPNYKSFPLEFFKPMVKNIFSRKPYSLL
ncbi:HD domain-containing protein [Candidatus Pelagibacter sp.]|nr:HD domain-containing protein [Candidatus Pelagibacter sp.]